MVSKADIQRNLRKLEGHHPGAMQEHTRTFRIVKHVVKDMYYEAGFRYKKVFEGGGFLYLHRDHVATARRSKYCKRGVGK